MANTEIERMCTYCRTINSFTASGEYNRKCIKCGHYLEGYICKVCGDDIGPIHLGKLYCSQCGSLVDQNLVEELKEKAYYAEFSKDWNPYGQGMSHIEGYDDDEYDDYVHEDDSSDYWDTDFDKGHVETKPEPYHVRREYNTWVNNQRVDTRIELDEDRKYSDEEIREIYKLSELNDMEIRDVTKSLMDIPIILQILDPVNIIFTCECKKEISYMDKYCMYCGRKVSADMRYKIWVNVANKITHNLIKCEWFYASIFINDYIANGFDFRKACGAVRQCELDKYMSEESYNTLLKHVGRGIKQRINKKDDFDTLLLLYRILGSDLKKNMSDKHYDMLEKLEREEEEWLSEDRIEREIRDM